MRRPHGSQNAKRASLDNCAEIFSGAIANAIAYEEERRLHLLFEAVGNATVAIASEFELLRVLQNIVDEARQVVAAEYGALGIVVAGNRAFGPWVFSGMTKEQESAIGRHPHPVGTLDIVALQGRIVRIDDVRRHSAFAGSPSTIRRSSVSSVCRFVIRAASSEISTSQTRLAHLSSAPKTSVRFSFLPRMRERLFTRVSGLVR